MSGWLKAPSAIYLKSKEYLNNTARWSSVPLSELECNITARLSLDGHRGRRSFSGVGASLPEPDERRTAFVVAAFGFGPTPSARRSAKCPIGCRQRLAARRIDPKRQSIAAQPWQPKARQTSRLPQTTSRCRKNLSSPRGGQARDLSRGDGAGARHAPRSRASVSGCGRWHINCLGTRAPAASWSATRIGC